jgi:hypothetical protein
LLTEARGGEGIKHFFAAAVSQGFAEEKHGEDEEEPEPVGMRKVGRHEGRKTGIRVDEDVGLNGVG